MKAKNLIIALLLVFVCGQKNAMAGFANLGPGNLIIIPRMGTFVQPSFTAIPPVPRRPGVYPWRIRLPNQPFFPVPRGVPLVQDYMRITSNAPIRVLPGAWWDPDMVVLNDEIRIFELFTTVDETVPPTSQLGFEDLTEVDDYLFLEEDGTTIRPLAVSDMQRTYETWKPAPLPELTDPVQVTIDSVSFFGAMTGQLYQTTVEECTFANLLNRLQELSPPGTVYDLSYYDGLSGRCVLAYADVPAGDVILYSEEIPEPATVLLLGLGGLALLRRRRR